MLRDGFYTVVNYLCDWQVSLNGGFVMMPSVLANLPDAGADIKKRLVNTRPKMYRFVLYDPYIFYRFSSIYRVNSVDVGLAGTGRAAGSMQGSVLLGTNPMLLLNVCKNKTELNPCSLLFKTRSPHTRAPGRGKGKAGCSGN